MDLLELFANVVGGAWPIRYQRYANRQTKSYDLKPVFGLKNWLPIISHEGDGENENLVERIHSFNKPYRGKV